MGAGQSTQTGSTPPSRALHVLRVTPSSPASRTNIEPFFDFVVGYESSQGDIANGPGAANQKKGMPGMSGSIDAAELEKIVERHEGRRLNLLVWSSKNQDTRVVPITPSREWTLPTSLPPTTSGPRQPTPPQFQRQPSKSNPQPQPSLLGLSMRMCEPEFAVDNVWHVLDVLEGSPAESAGLVPYGDWVLGWSGGVLSAEADFYDVVEAHIDKPLRVYVYSYDFDTIREVVLVPNRQWGGEGLLGCVFGFGLLHRIPPMTEHRQPGYIPPELQEPTGNGDEYEEQNLFVPADSASSSLHYDYEQAQYDGPEYYSYSNRGAAFGHDHDHHGHDHYGHDHHDHDHHQNHTHAHVHGGNQNIPVVSMTIHEDEEDEDHADLPRSLLDAGRARELSNSRSPSPGSNNNNSNTRAPLSTVTSQPGILLSNGRPSSYDADLSESKTEAMDNIRMMAGSGSRLPSDFSTSSSDYSSRGRLSSEAEHDHDSIGDQDGQESVAGGTSSAGDNFSDLGSLTSVE